MSQLLQYYKSFQQTNKSSSPPAVPTFEDLSIDDNLTELQQLVRYAKSSIGMQRLVHVKHLSDVATLVGYEDTHAYIIPLVEGFANDTEKVIRQHLTEQLAPIAELCFTHGKQEGYNTVIDQLLPVISCLLEDLESEVRQSACNTIVCIAKHLVPDDLGQHILTIILRLAHDDDKEEMRMTACEMLNSLSESLGHDLCRQFIIPEIVSLAEDQFFRVRKATALNFHYVCKVGGEHELFERLMPAFVRLSKDDVFRVRRACADSLCQISNYVSDDIRLGVLVEVYLRLAQDPSKLVKQSILQQSGQFISTLPSKSISDSIIYQYCSMALGPTGDVSIDAELKYHCAYSFPAVLQTIGKERWKDLRDTYHILVQSPTPNVKQTLAASLHEVARILDDETLVNMELIPVFEDMIQDTVDVKLAVIKYSAAFLKLLSGPCRVSYLPSLHDILHSTNPLYWRLRQYLALQLPELIQLPAEDEVYNTLFPLIMTLLQDPVASVRKEVFKGVSSLINILVMSAEKEKKKPGALQSSIPQQQLDAVIQTCNSLIHGESYQSRLLWAELAHQLLRDIPKHIFEQYFIDGILDLTCDSVSNVRVAVGILLGGWAPLDLPPWETQSAPIVSDNSSSSSSSSSICNANNGIVRMSPWKWLLERPDIRICVERLARDDSDVYYGIISIQPMFPDINFQPISVRGKKIAPGGRSSILRINPINISDTITDISNISFNPLVLNTAPQHASGGLILVDEIDSLPEMMSEYTDKDNNDGFHGNRSYSDDDGLDANGVKLVVVSTNNDSASGGNDNSCSVSADDHICNDNTISNQSCDFNDSASSSDGTIAIAEEIGVTEQL